MCTESFPEKKRKLQRFRLGYSEAPIFWPPYVKSQLLGKDPDAGKFKIINRLSWHILRWYILIPFNSSENVTNLRSIDHSVCVLSRVWLFATPWTVVRQAPLSMEFSRQEYWSGLPFPPPRDLPNWGFGPASPVSPALAGRFFTAYDIRIDHTYTKKKKISENLQ